MVNIMNPTSTAPDLLARLAEMLQNIPGGEIAFTALMFVLVLGVLVFVHEWGHYAAARSVGVRVIAFSIGFGRPFARWKDKQGTQWQLAWLPLGGYVQLHGQEDGKPYGQFTDHDAFSSKSVLARMWVIIAGPLMNIVFAFLLLTAVMLTGDHKLKAEVGSIMPNMPAAGLLQQKDLITAANGQPINEWDDFQTYVQAHPGQPVALSVTRNNQPLTVTVTPQTMTVKDLLGDVSTIGRIGIAPSYSTFVVQYGPLEAVREGAAKTWQLTALTVKSLYKLVIGAISADNLTGPLGIADMAGQTAANGLFAVAMFMAVISINLGIVNLVPLPVLDGGHLVFLAYEGLFRRPVSARVQAGALRLGLVLIVMLAVFATLNDVKRFGWVPFLKKPEAPAEQVLSTQQAPGSQQGATQSTPSE